MDDHRRVPAPPPGEAGVGHLFGVPGDFNLELLQQLEDTGTAERAAYRNLIGGVAPPRTATYRNPIASGSAR
jgi:hypothetical protein